MTSPRVRLFLTCSSGVEPWLAQEAQHICGCPAEVQRGGVSLDGGWAEAMRLNLHSRLAQRVLFRLAEGGYRSEDDVYALAHKVPWEDWFTAEQALRVDVSAQRSPLRSLNFVTLRVKDAVVDRLRERTGERPNVDTVRPDARVFVHLGVDHASVYLDTSGEPLFKRGWRMDKGEAPLKETLAAAMIAASGWDATQPFFDPCCGSGTLVIEAAQIACGMAPGLSRPFGFERLPGTDRRAWRTLKEEARATQHAPTAPIFGSDVSFRMVDFARRNAERAGVVHAIQLQAADALQRPAPADHGVLLLNPPYGERITAQGSIHRGREADGGAAPDDFFVRLAAHWKRGYAGWVAHVLSPEPKLPGQMRLKASRRVPMWNGAIECRLFRFDMVAGSHRAAPAAQD